MNRLILLAILALIATSTLKVYLPNCAAKLFPNPIEYSLSNFGYIPYGETFIGQIEIPTDKQLCSTDQEIKNTKPKDNIKRIFLIERGECKFTQKVINAQKLGADAAIIYDNFTSSEVSVIMKNDGHGHLIEITSMFISNADGLKLQQAIKDCNEPVVLQIKFDVFKS